MTSTVRSIALAIAFSFVLLAPVGCSVPKGDTAAAKRESVGEMCEGTLAEAYGMRPGLRGKIHNAAGYAVFSNTGANLLILATGHGYGVVHDNRTGRDTYMRMIEVGGGLGLGLKQFRAVFVFNTSKALERFVESGWEFGADADAAAKAGDEGGAVGADVSSGELDGLEIYQFTENGLALSATATGTKYYKDDELNGE